MIISLSEQTVVIIGISLCITVLVKGLLRVLEHITGEE